MKKKILIVDDDLDILEQMTAVLTAAGYEVMNAESRGVAEEVILKTRPDLAIVDLMMEEKDSGFVLSYQLKKLFPEIPVIMLTAVAGATGLSFATQQAEARSWIKVDAMMDKPVRPEQLKSEVRRLLGEPGESSKHNG